MPAPTLPMILPTMAVVPIIPAAGAMPISRLSASIAGMKARAAEVAPAKAENVRATRKAARDSKTPMTPTRSDLRGVLVVGGVITASNGNRITTGTVQATTASRQSSQTSTAALTQLPMAMPTGINVPQMLMAMATILGFSNPAIQLGAPTTIKR